MKLTKFLLLKYLRFDKTQPFISITALLAFLGVGVGVMVLIVAMAIMNGMSKEFEKKLFVMNYPLSIFATSSKGVPQSVLEMLEREFPHLLFSPYLQMQAVARSGSEMSAGMIFGVDMAREARINEVFAKAYDEMRASKMGAVSEERIVEAGAVVKGGVAKGAGVMGQASTMREVGVMSKTSAMGRESSFMSKADSSGAKDFGESTRGFRLIVGSALQERFMLERGDKLTLFFTKLEPTGLVLSPLMKRFDIAGVFDSGIKAYDLGYFYTDFKSLARLRNIKNGVFDGIHVYSPKPMEDIHALREVLKRIPHYGVGLEGWWQQNGNFFAAMALEKRALFIVLMLIILMASLNIISSLLMVIMNRRKEIALLLSMGASAKEIKQVFFWLGNAIGFGGITLGVVLAFVAMWILGTFPIISLPADVYGVSKLPLDLALWDLVGTIVGAVVIVCASSYYPAHRASKIDALYVLRNE